MLQKVDIGEWSLARYRDVIGAERLEELVQLAGELRGARVLHLNATPYGGGVSELLRSMVPLLNDLGIAAEWKVIAGDAPFFKATKAIHNGLQGAERGVTAEERAVYEATNAANAADLHDGYDFVFVHDPQPAPILSLHGKGNSHWVWRCHIDTSQPNPSVWRYIRDFLGEYDAAIFTMPDFLPPDLPIERVAIIPPAIDPLSPKNMSLPIELSRQILDWIGVEQDGPLVTQISRFDPWKDPLGVLEAYRLARREIPGLQLVLAGSMALDDPEGWDIYRLITAASEGDDLIHLFTNLTGVGNVEVNAFQRLSDVVVQKSLREGFGLVVSEAMWKGTPVVAGRAGGIPLQMADGCGGTLVDTVDECAAAIVDLVSDPERSVELAEHGRERVRRHFLLPRLLLNELSLMVDLARGRPDDRRVPEIAHDPVCGMAVHLPAEVTETFRGHEFNFCSEACRTRFRGDPERFAA